MDLMIRHTDGTESDDCAHCGRHTFITPGPQLYDSDTGTTVCRACAARQAPSLAALLDLGKAAERVGRVCRHTLIPPLETLLELARAAEVYHIKAPEVVGSSFSRERQRARTAAAR